MQVNWQKPLNSADGLKYLSIIWYIIGTNRPNTSLQKHWRFLYYIYAVIMNFSFCFLFSYTTLANLFFIDSYKELVANLSLSFTIAISPVKQLFILRHRQLLLESKRFLRSLDERCDRYSQDRQYVLSAIRYSQLYILYIPFYIFCGCGFGYSGWSHHQLIYNAWYPAIFANPEQNYLASFVHQYLSQSFCTLQSIFSDIYPMCYLGLMIGHLESLAVRITRIGWDKRMSDSQEQNIEELKNCIRDHKNLLSYFDCVRPVISDTLSCQFVCAALSLCMAGVNLIFFVSDLNEQFFILMYLIILLIQMFPCCWYVNAVMEKSNYLTTAMYSCNWMDQNIKFRKILIIFMQRSQKTNTIIAGGLSPVTLQTFLAIIRFSFSMFTIFSKM